MNDFASSLACSKRPYRHANKLSLQLEARIVELKKERPSWGAPKIRERLKRLYGSNIQLPAISTVHAVLDRHGLVSRGRKRRYRAQGTGLSASTTSSIATTSSGLIRASTCTTRPRSTARQNAPTQAWMSCATQCGRICLAERRKINVTSVLAGQNVGIRQVDEHVWLVTFMHYDPGFFDDGTCRLEPAKNPFEAAVLPMSPV